MPKTFFALCTNLVYDIRSGYQKLMSILVTVWGLISIKKTGRKINRCLEFLSHRQFFPSVSYKISARHHCLFFKIIEVGRKNFDATDGNKFDLSVKKIFPLYLFK
jgi:hypothetical protein